MQRKWHFFVEIVILIYFLLVGFALATPSVVTYQGKLINPDGTPVETSVYSIHFGIYNMASGGSPIWEESQSVSVIDGLFSVTLPENPGANPFPGTLLDTPSLFLGIQVESDAEMTARQEITSTFYALKAGDADTLEGFGSATFALADHIHAGGHITSGTISEMYIDPSIARDSEITWENLAGVPSDIADGDQGITTETDPTVPESVKDGISWDELSGIPRGFEDGVDNVSEGGITSVIAGTGLEGSGTSGDISLNVKTPLHLTKSIMNQGAINGTNDIDFAIGYGISGTATGRSGRGVYGKASDTSGVTNYGGFFQAQAEPGIGVYGNALGAFGIGVYGEARNTGDEQNYGGYFKASGEKGKGVYAEAKDTGVYGTASAWNGKGIHGEARYMGVSGLAPSTENITNHGGYFVANGEQAQAVYGWSTSISEYKTYGGYFTASGEFGRGVYGEATYSGTVDPGNDDYNYGGYFQAAGDRGIGVYGKASKTGLAKNYGGKFESKGDRGRGVFGEATKSEGIGVVGAGGSQGYGFYAEGGGADYGPFTGAHEVRLAPDVPDDIRAGMIMSVTGETMIRKDDRGKIGISATLPTVRLCSKANDRAVLGAFVFEASLPDGHWSQPNDGERFGVVNALGEGRVLVTNLNGDIAVGDYITTSPVPGCGQLQNDDLLHSYTVGKAIETVNWEAVTDTVEYEAQEVKVYLIAVVYTSG